MTETKSNTQQDMVNSPDHYTKNEFGIQCIDAIRAQLNDEEFIGFLRGNAAKYNWRCRYKGKTVEDIKKAQWYLNRLEEELEAIARRKAAESVAEDKAKAEESKREQELEWLDNIRIDVQKRREEEAARKNELEREELLRKLIQETADRRLYTYKPENWHSIYYMKPYNDLETGIKYNNNFPDLFTVTCGAVNDQNL